MTRGNGSGRDRSAAESTSAEETVGVQNSDHESSEATVAAGPSPVSGERTMSAQLGGERTVSAQLSGERTAAAPTIDGERTAAAPTLGAERPSEGSRTVTAVPVDTLITRPPTRETLDDVEVGQQVDDFDLLMGLGSGAFGRVFLARQRSMQRLVAVKISHDHGNEPQTLAQLDHDYIVRVFDQRLLEDRKLRLLYMQDGRAHV